jgi:hypothetical protein
MHLLLEQARQQADVYDIRPCQNTISDLIELVESKTDGPKSDSYCSDCGGKDGYFHIGRDNSFLFTCYKCWEKDGQSSLL